MWSFQTLENFDNEVIFSGFDSVEDLQNVNVIPDNILGLGNKKKKAEKKIAKAEKALEQGNTKKAERKLNKAIKKGSQVAEDNRGNLAEEIKTVQSKIETENQTKTDFKDSIRPKLTPLKTVDPITLQDNPNVSGGGLDMPLSGVSGGGGGSYEEPQMMSQTSTASDTSEAGQVDPSVMPEAVVTAKPNYIVYAVAAFILIGVVLFLKRKK